MEELVVAVPARIGSTRLPRKPLIELLGKPLIGWVIEGIKTFHSKVLVATDSREVAKVAREFGAEAVITPPELPSGSDRVYHAVKELPCRFVINVQGDEPLVRRSHLEALYRALKGGAEFATLAVPFGELEEVKDPSKVKVVVNSKGEALYFSRSPVPFVRDGKPKAENYLKHLGLYGYTKEALEEFVSWPVGKLEELEKLEQLRILEAGRKIKVEVVKEELYGVDTPKDLKRVEEILKRRGSDGF
jgi:3-deoxy-manno-octulosonate cytidylyltransferase (CMP-KDO synthetase)